VLDRRDNVIRVPDQSLRYSASRLDAGDQDLKTPPAGWARVWVLRNGRPTAVAVRLGLDDGVYIEVVEGDLLPGDQLFLGEGGD
jgi:HlyD family secretion protein